MRGVERRVAELEKRLKLLRLQVDEHGRLLSALCAEGCRIEARYAEPSQAEVAPFSLDRKEPIDS